MIHSFTVMGRSVRRLPDSLLLTYPQISWDEIKAYPDDFVVHYDKIDLNHVWNIVLDLPNLKAAVLAMQKSLTDEE